MIDNCIIYSRVSTDKQAERGVSLEVQGNLIRNYCEHNELHIYKSFTDAGQSGSDWNRPQFQLMLKALEDLTVKNLVVYSIDRLSRDASDLMQLAKKLITWKIKLHTIYGMLDIEDSQGFLIFGINAIMAQCQVMIIRNNTTNALQLKKSKHQRVGGLPYGFKVTDVGGEKVLHRNIDEQKVIMKANHYYQRGYNLTAISQILFDEEFLDRKGNKFDTTQIRRMIPDYIPTHRKSI